MLRNDVSRKPLNLVGFTKALAIAWVVLSLAEASVTYICLQNSANVEGNPLARLLLSHNEALFYGAKLLVTAAVGLGFWLLSDRTKYLKLMLVFQILLVAMFAVILINNILHL
jgi:Domain of unknown function (DUF5658)